MFVFFLGELPRFLDYHLPLSFILFTVIHLINFIYQNSSHLFCYHPNHPNLIKVIIFNIWSSFFTSHTSLSGCFRLLQYSITVLCCVFQMNVIVSMISLSDSNGIRIHNHLVRKRTRTI